MDRTLSEHCERLKALGLGSALIDGEIVVEDASGISSFNDLQADLKTGRLDRFRYFVFDVLYCEGFDLTKVILKDRKDLLRQLLAILPPGSPIRFSEHLDVDGPTMLEHACRLGLEGIITILGYIPSTAASRSVGSLRWRSAIMTIKTLFTRAGSQVVAYVPDAVPARELRDSSRWVSPVRQPT